MEHKTNRLYFIDAIRAWAILMMLQGHFVDGLLDPLFRELSNPVYRIWAYFRGITAPVFFTVSGFIFTYLLVRGRHTGLENPRVSKGIKRGLQLLFLGYLLRLNLFGLYNGEIYNTFSLVDVLQCIGLSIIGITGIYLLLVTRRKWMFPLTLLGVTLFLFLLEPAYKQWSYPLLPDAVENYLTKANGSIFTIIPWFGYSTFGAFLSLLFSRYKNYRYLYPSAIIFSLAAGAALVYSSSVFTVLSSFTGHSIYLDLLENNYLFIRLGNVLFVFAIFMLLKDVLKNRTILRLGQSTLSIYVIHFVILYGSLTGFGLHYYLNQSLSPFVAIPGALAFMLICSYLALKYEVHEPQIKLRLSDGLKQFIGQAEQWAQFSIRLVRIGAERLLRVLGFVKSQ
jgi:uncharacterized membrane protein